MASILLAIKASIFFFNYKVGLPIKIVTILIVFLTILWHRRVLKNSNIKAVTPLPRGPRGLPLVGYLPFLDPQVHRALADLACSYGPIFELWLGRKLCVVITSPTLAKQVLREHDAIFANRDTTAAAMVFSFGESDVVFSPIGPHWRKVRKVLVREMMSNTSLNASYELRREELRKTIREVNSRVGKAVDVGEMAFLTVLNTLMNLIWGGTLDGAKGHSLGMEFRKVIVEMFQTLSKPNISDYFPTIAWLDVQGVQKDMRRVVKWIEKILDSVIEERKKLIEKGGVGEELFNSGRRDFLQILLELNERESDGASLTLTEIKAMLLGVVTSGTDTITAMVEWTMTELIRHPNIMEKVKEELTSIVGVEDIVEESHITKLQYLDAVVKETFRLYPIVPLLVPRRPSATCTVGGYTIPKGATIFLNVWAMQRDPEAWESPLEFKPERFLHCEGNWDYSGNNFQYLPFGSGRRMCAGAPLGQKMIMYILASLLHSFEWKLPKDENLDVSETYGIVMRKSKPLMAIPMQRLSNSKFYA